MMGWKTWRRRRLMQRPLPAAWLGVLIRNVPYYLKLSEAEQRQLQGLIQVFLAEKRFEGCGGLEITDEIRVTVAAHACLLLLGREPAFYPGLYSILVYPHPFVSKVTKLQPDGTVWEGPQVRLGQSSPRGSVVLAWDAVLKDVTQFDDGRNVVLHEFAHQLDSQSGAMEGAPQLPKGSMYAAWAYVLGREYAALVADLSRHRATFLNPYGATNPAEFFAVVTEYYFEKPLELKERHPDLFEQLKLFYGHDPSRLNPKGNEPTHGH
ncbi:MAG TPA: M90 family metallopeptidase [Candidatus Bipolaricaulota bacterium]